MATDIQYKQGDRDERPWGSWEVLDVGEHYIVKRIIVQPGGVLSLQRHQHRNEHWTIVEGEAQVTLGEERQIKQADEAVYIPAGAVHRIANETARAVVFIEVQTGKVLREDDIERLDDQYGRSTPDTA